MCLYDKPAQAMAPAVQLSSEQQLIWLNLMGRCLVTGAKLLQEAPKMLMANGFFVMTSNLWPEAAQFSNYVAMVVTALTTVMHMHTMLEQQGGAAAAAVVAGTAATTTASLAGLVKQASGLQQQLMAIDKALCPGRYDADGNLTGVDDRFKRTVMPIEQALAGQRRLREACASGSLLQDLASFGAACAAFPQPGCCGNPACSNLDKLSEAALASRYCSGCKVGFKQQVAL